MLFRTPRVDNLIQWHYSVVVDDRFLDFIAFNVRTEIQVECRDDSANIQEMLERNLVAEFAANKREIAKTKAAFERWHIFVNPFKRLSLLVTQHRDRLIELNIDQLAPPEYPSDLDGFEEYRSVLTKIQALCNEAMSLTIAIQVFAPIMGESLVNLLLLLLAKPEIRNDKRMFQDFQRRNIDIRIKSLHFCCNGFSQPISGSEDEFKDFIRLMQRRNKTHHGNVDPMNKVGHDIYFDHSTIPLVEAHHPIGEIAMENSLAFADPSAALADVGVVERFVAFVLGHLEPSVRRQVELVLDTLQLGYRLSNRQIGLILPQFEVDIIPVMKPNGGDERA